VRYFIFSIMLCIALDSCLSYGNGISSNVDGSTYRTAALSYSDSMLYVYSDVQIFFSNKPMGNNLEYLELGTIELEGGQYTTDEEMMEKFKRDAYNMYAHAVISVKASFKTKTRGYYEIKDKRLKDNVVDTYQAMVYTGIAIRYKSKKSISPIINIPHDSVPASSRH
jgi:hypothetical protein